MKVPYTMNVPIALLFSSTLTIYVAKEYVNKEQSPVVQQEANHIQFEVKELNDSMEVHSFSKLQDYFDEISYTLDDSVVPEVYVQNLDNSFLEMSLNHRKKVFLKTLLPLALRANQKVVFEKARVTMLDEHEDSLELARLFFKYRAKSKEELLEKINIVPIPMIMAQSILESGWGTSRFAVRGCALFGQHSYATSDKVLDAKYSSVKMKCFENLQESVDAYILNLNRHRAYRHFRRLRLNMLEKENELNSIVLLGCLKAYSERGHSYLNTAIQIIRNNDLLRLENHQLAMSRPQFINVKDTGDLAQN